jgi:hypothetical protein
MRAKIHSEISTIWQDCWIEENLIKVREVIHTQLLQYEIKAKAFLVFKKKKLKVNSF